MDLGYAEQFYELAEWLGMEPCPKAGGNQSVGIKECLGNFCILGEDCYRISKSDSRTTSKEYRELVGITPARPAYATQ